MQEQMELVLQNPQQCTELLQLCLARTEVLTLLPSALRLRLVPGPSTGEEEVETPSEHSMTSGLPLQVRAPRDTTPSSADLAQWPTTHLVGMIRASTDQLEQRLQQAKRSAEFAREEALLAQACRKQEEHAKIQVKHRLERVQERLVEAWPKIWKVAPQLPEASDAGESEHQIELLQGAWSQLAIHAEHLEVQLRQTQQGSRETTSEAAGADGEDSARRKQCPSNTTQAHN
jgi:hypothetical protein